MRIITINQIYNQDPEQFEDITDVAGYIEEMEACKTLDFFHITFDPSQTYLTIPDTFDPTEANYILSTYLDIVEADDEEDNMQFVDQSTPIRIIARAQEYNTHTMPHRGADDGTYDYAGSYPITIFSILEQLLTPQS